MLKLFRRKKGDQEPYDALLDRWMDASRKPPSITDKWVEVAAKAVEASVEDFVAGRAHPDGRHKQNFAATQRSLGIAHLTDHASREIAARGQDQSQTERKQQSLFTLAALRYVKWEGSDHLTTLDRPVYVLPLTSGIAALLDPQNWRIRREVSNPRWPDQAPVVMEIPVSYDDEKK